MQLLLSIIVIVDSSIVASSYCCMLHECVMRVLHIQYVRMIGCIQQNLRTMIIINSISSTTITTIYCVNSYGLRDGRV